MRSRHRSRRSRDQQEWPSTTAFCGKHGVDRPSQFRSTQPARLCAKDVYVLLEQLRSNARENQGERDVEPETSEAVGAETLGQAG